MDRSAERIAVMPIPELDWAKPINDRLRRAAARKEITDMSEIFDAD